MLCLAHTPRESQLLLSTCSYTEVSSVKTGVDLLSLSGDDAWTSRIRLIVCVDGCLWTHSTIGCVVCGLTSIDDKFNVL